MRRKRNNRPTSRTFELIERRRHLRTIVMGFIFSVCLILLMYQIWYYQAVWGEEYAQLSARQGAIRQIGQVSRDVAPTLGLITDRNMQPIASSQQVFTVFLDVYALHNRHLRQSSQEDGINIRDDVLAQITAAFGTSYRELISHFATEFDSNNLVRNNRHLIIAHDVLPEIAVPLTADIPELHAREGSLRWHHDPFFAPQVLGFTWGDYTWGLELLYMDYLRGEHGRTIWVQGGEVEEIAVRNGFSLVTTFDSDIQRLAQRIVDETYRDITSNYVGIIVMNPHTGEIIAMAQAPNFSMAEPMNHLLFTDPTVSEYWDTMSGAERTNEVMRFWRNYHITRAGEPGSTFKPFVVSAAIEEGVLDANFVNHSMFYCEGHREILDQVVWCWNEWGHGHMSLRQALYMSCNLAMVDINNMLGRDTFYRYRGYFGFGMHTGVDLPGETDVSSPAVMYTRERLNPVEMATSSMGQGFNTTTMQMIAGYAALINGGNIMQPFFVQQIVDNHGNIIRETQPTVVRRAISPQTSDFIRRELEFGVTELRGTGRAIAVPGHRIGGKTGTGQQGVRADGINSVSHVAFIPVENPEFLVIMMVDTVHRDYGTAGVVVSPRLNTFFRELIALRNIQPSDGVMTPGDVLVHLGLPIMPDYSGRRLADIAPTILELLGLSKADEMTGKSLLVKP